MKSKFDISPSRTINLNNAPSNPIKISDDTWLTLGDMHGNSLKLLHLLMEYGFATFGQDNHFYYNNFLRNYNDLRTAFEINNVNYQEQCFKNLKNIIDNIQWSAGKLRLIGDLVADRGVCDAITLYLLSKLIESKNISLEILISNHDLVFLTCYEKDWFNVEGELPLGKTFSTFIAVRNIHAYRSVTNLKLLLDNKILNYKELEEMVNAVYYQGALKVLAYDDMVPSNIKIHQPEGESLTLYSHAPIDHRIIQPKEITLESVKQAIDEKNKILNDNYVSNKSLSKLFLDYLSNCQKKQRQVSDYHLWAGEENNDFKIITAAFNQTLELQNGRQSYPIQIFYVHGHVHVHVHQKSEKNILYVVEIDDLLGKSDHPNYMKHECHPLFYQEAIEPNPQLNNDKGSHQVNDDFLSDEESSDEESSDEESSDEELNAGLNAGLNAELNEELNAEHNAEHNAELNAGLNAELNAGLNAEHNAELNAEHNAGLNAELNAEHNAEHNAELNAGLNEKSNNYQEVISGLDQYIKDCETGHRPYRFGGIWNEKENREKNVEIAKCLKNKLEQNDINEKQKIKKETICREMGEKFNNHTIRSNDLNRFFKAADTIYKNLHPEDSFWTKLMHYLTLK